MKLMWLKKIGAVVVVLALTACVTNGGQFSSNVDWIKENVTDKERVRNLLGAPYSVGNSSGKATWTYGYYRYKLIGKSYQKELKFYWNPDGSVNSYSFNSSFPDDTGQK